MARDCPHPRYHGALTIEPMGMQLKECPELIAKWEDRVRQQGTNLISSEIKRVIIGKIPNLNIVTRGGAKTDTDADNLPQIQERSA
jgi:hypothetical protein